MCVCMLEYIYIYSRIDKNSKQFFDLRQTFFVFRTAVSNTRSKRSVQITIMIGTHSPFYLLYTILICFLIGKYKLSSLTH